MKKAIVTGATGFIGSEFVKFLTNKGVDVLALGRRPLGAVSCIRREKLKAAKYLVINMSEISTLKRRIEEIGWVLNGDSVFFNLAWGGGNGLSDLNVEAQMNNVVWSVRALEVAAHLKCHKFIHVGTMEEAFTYKYLELDHAKNNEYNRHVVYSVAKIAAKYALKIRSSQVGIDFIYVLHSHVMGPGDDKDSFLQVTLKKLMCGAELIFSTGEQYFDVVSTSDCCKGYFLICEKGVPGSEYWVGSGEPKRLREYVERMYALFPSGEKMQFGKLPYNDIMLREEDFSIDLLTRHTGYRPSDTYENTVKELHSYLCSMKTN